MANKFFKAYKFLTGGKSRPGIVGVKPKSGGAADEFKSRKLKDMGKKMRKLKSQDKEMGEAIKDAKKKGVARKDLVGGRKIQRDSRRLQREGDKLRKDVLRVGKKDGGPTFNYDKDHPKVQSLKKFVNKNREEKNKKIGAKIFGKKKPMTDKEAKKFADKIETRTSKRVSKTEGSFAKGGKVLKPVDKQKNPGLAKLPTQVRNKMGYMKDGGKVKKFGGGKK